MGNQPPFRSRLCRGALSTVLALTGTPALAQTYQERQFYEYVIRLEQENGALRKRVRELWQKNIVLHRAYETTCNKVEIERGFPKPRSDSRPDIIEDD
jgi:hypothetical protein